MLEWFLAFSIASHHFNDSRTFQEINPGGGLGVFVDEHFHAEAGGYRNSGGTASWYGVVGVERMFGRIGLGIESGFVTGYQWPVLPIVFPYVLVRAGRLDVKVNVLPMQRTIVGVQLRWKI